MYADCAFGARLLYGTNIFFSVASVFLIGYRQISLGVTIQSIV